MTKAAKVKIRVSAQPVVVMEAEVARKIRQHCRTSMKAEVCGVLVGSTEHERMMVEACIQVNNAAQGGAHVTFTQDTWEHIYKIKDKEYPDQKIVGWYHSHPGFGVFLSEHDLFIQQNFFSNPQQVAWVYDPHTDEEGCFGWIGGSIEKLSAIRVGYTQNVEVDASGAGSNDFEDEDAGLDSMVKVGRERQPEEPVWVRWASVILRYVAAVIMGFALGYFLHQWQVDRALRAVADQAALGQQVAQHPVEACQDILRQVAPSLLAPVGPSTPMPQAAPQAQSSPATPQRKSSQSSPPQEQAPAQKGNNAKH